MVERTIDVGPIGSPRNPVLIGGFSTMISSGDDVATDGHYNGKIDSPRLFSRALERHEIASLRDGASPRAFETCLVGAWDLSRDASKTRVVDDSSHGLDGGAGQQPEEGGDRTQLDGEGGELQARSGRVRRHPFP